MLSLNLAPGTAAQEDSIFDVSTLLRCSRVCGRKHIPLHTTLYPLYSSMLLILKMAQTHSSALLLVIPAPQSILELTVHST